LAPDPRLVTVENRVANDHRVPHGFVVGVSEFDDAKSPNIFMPSF
jgi:hypothetical protein